MENLTSKSPFLDVSCTGMPSPLIFLTSPGFVTPCRSTIREAKTTEDLAQSRCHGTDDRTVLFRSSQYLSAQHLHRSFGEGTLPAAWEATQLVIMQVMKLTAWVAALTFVPTSTVWPSR